MLIFEATGTIWKINSEDFNVQKIEKEILEKIFELDLIFSRFNPKSFLFKLNLNQKAKNPPKIFLENLEFALQISKITNGEFSVFVGGVLENFGYGNLKNKDFYQNFQENYFQQNFQNLIKFDKKEVFLFNSSLDFGSFGKGLIIDEVVKVLDKFSENFVINAGGDIFVRSPVLQEIFVENPMNRSKPWKKIKIANASVCASSNFLRTWEKDGKSFSHIIRLNFNPENQKIVGSFAVSKTAKIADLLSTIFFITGKKYEKILQEFLKEDFSFGIFRE
ncbi:MAG: hypothetical protein Fur0024_5250 [Patescibacteria group bacterium]